MSWAIILVISCLWILALTASVSLQKKSQLLLRLPELFWSVTLCPIQSPSKTLALVFLTLSCHQLVSNALQLLLKYLLSKPALQKGIYLKWRIKIQFYHITAVNTAMQRNLLFFILNILSQKILLTMETTSLSSLGSKAENRQSTALPSRQKWRKIRALVFLRPTGKSYRCLLQHSFLR